MNFLMLIFGMMGLTPRYIVQDGGGGSAGGGGAGGAGGGKDGGGAGGAGGSAGGGQKGGDGGNDPAARIATLEGQIAELMKGLKAQGGGGSSGESNNDDPDLRDKARNDRDAADKSRAREKQLESAINFNLKAKDFLKQNETLLPKEVSDIFAQAEKENFADAIEKDAAVKSGLIQSFFSVQANVDMLTAGQKSTLDDYLKLTKSGKQEKAQEMYAMIFEPAFEMLKRVKRAEALQRGHASSSDVEDNYRKRLLAHSRKHYLGEKADA